MENLSRKLLAYSLNRSLQLSDESLVDKMTASLVASGYKFRALVEAIVTSPQFVDRRIVETTAQSVPQGQPQAGGGKFIKIDFKKGN